MKKEFDPRWTFHLGNWWLALGWYAGDPFALFKLVVCETMEYKGRVDSVEVFDIQCLRAAVSVGFSR